MTATLYNGDCLELMRGMRDGSVDAIVTDPPYGTGQWKRKTSGQGGDPTACWRREEWDVFDLAWLTEAMRISCGPVLIFTPCIHIHDVVTHEAIVGQSWRLLIWTKTDPKPRPSRQVSFGFEPIIAVRALRNVGGKDYCAASSPRLGRDRDGTGHPHQKPLAIMQWLCRMAVDEGATILDPYMGSGSTGVACVNTNRDFIGIEQDAGYFAIATARVEQAQNTARQAELEVCEVGA